MPPKRRGDRTDMNRLKELPSAAAWDIFSMMSRIPRASGNEQAVGDALLDYAKKHGLDGIKDESGNLIIKAKASKGHENAPSLAFQGHIDMVAVGPDDHDFAKDPIKLRIDDIKDIPCVTACGTTLGADNGVGVSIALAIMTDKELKHGPLEAIFTVAEETSMGGMNALKPGLIDSKFMINLDSENDEELIVGCAGGADVKLSKSFDRVAVPEGYKAYRVTVGNLKGGHSGIEIHKNRGNAVRLAAGLMEKIGCGEDVYLLSAEGGTFRNAIPVSCAFTIAVAEAKEQEFLKAIDDADKDAKEQLTETDPAVYISCDKLESDVLESGAIPHDAAKDLVAVINKIPNGVLSKSDLYPDVVENSSNIGVLQTEDSCVYALCLARSLKETDPITSVISSIAQNHGMTAEISNQYPGWDPAPSSMLRDMYEQTYEDFNFKKPLVQAIHAGLECGIFKSKYPDVDVISFGPTITGAHTAEEHVAIHSVEKCYGLVLELVSQFADK